MEETTMSDPTPMIHMRPAKLSEAQRDPEEWLYRLADAEGVRPEFETIVQRARNHGLYARFQNNWWPVAFTPDYNRNKIVLMLFSDLSQIVYMDELCDYLGCNPADVLNTIGDHGPVEPAEVPGWLERFDALMQYPRKKEPASDSEDRPQPRE